MSDAKVICCKNCDYWDGTRFWGECVCPDMQIRQLTAAEFLCGNFKPNGIAVDGVINGLEAK